MILGFQSANHLERRPKHGGQATSTDRNHGVKWVELDGQVEGFVPRWYWMELEA